MTYLSEIARLTSANLGGVVELKVARAQDIISMQDPIGDSVIGDITFQSGTGFYTWRATSQTIALNAKSANSQEGTYKSSSISFNLSKDRQGISEMLSLAEQDEFVILVKDANGQQKLFGTKSSPVSFSYSRSSGEAHAGRNFYSCQFTFDGPENFYFYDGTITAPAAGPPPVVIQWNGVTQTTAQPGDVVNVISEFKIDDFEVNINVS